MSPSTRHRHTHRKEEEQYFFATDVNRQPATLIEHTVVTIRETPVDRSVQATVDRSSSSKTADYCTRRKRRWRTRQQLTRQQRSRQRWRSKRRGRGGCVAEEKDTGTEKAVAWEKRRLRRRKRSMALAAEAAGMGRQWRRRRRERKTAMEGERLIPFYLFIYFIHLF